MTTYLVISFGYWGRGATEDEAKKNWKKAGGLAKHGKTFIYKVEHAADQEKPWVDGCGTMCWHGDRTKVAELVKGKRTDMAVAC